MPTLSPFHAAVIGAGPAGLMAAEVLAQGGARVTVYDRMPSAGRKFLMAGRGGLNLTHSEELPRFLARYGAALPHLRAAIEAFPPSAVRAWCEGLGQDTFVGSSGRVFPKSFKTSPLLRAWLRRLGGAGVEFKLRHCWVGWGERGDVLFDTPEGPVTVHADAVVLALGGASWPRLGSDGGWVECSGGGRCRHCAAPAGQLRLCRPLVRAVSRALPGPAAEADRLVVQRADRCAARRSSPGRGLEGGGIYALAAPLREAIAAAGEAVLHIALRPDLSVAELQDRLERPRHKQSLSNFLRKTVNLSPPAIGLLHEAIASTPDRFAEMDAPDLAALINAVPVRLVGAGAARSRDFHRRRHFVR